MNKQVVYLVISRENDSDDSLEDESTHDEKIVFVDKQQITDDAQSTVTTQLMVPATQVQYVETLTFDPNTGLCTTSTAPTVLESDASLLLQGAEQMDDSLMTKQVVVIQENKGERDPNYVGNKISYLKCGKRYSRLSLSNRKGVPQNSKRNVCNRCGKSFANVSTLCQ